MNGMDEASSTPWQASGRGADPTPAGPPALLRSAAASVPLDEARLAAYLQGLGMALDRDAGARQFRGGLANLNYLVLLDGQRVVLRRPPDGPLPPGAHDMAREHRILSLLWRALPLAPRSLHLCTDSSVLGVPFQLIEFRHGTVIRGDERGPLDGNPLRAERAGEMLVETLARVHEVDTPAVGLDGLGRPEGFVQRAIAGWRARAAQAGLTREAERASHEIGRWLEAQPVRRRDPVLLHCDFKLDNLILDPATLEPLAIVDWDMGTRGDPLFDLATLLSYWSEPADPPCMQRLAQMPSAAPGFPGRARAIELYARRTGRDVSDIETLRVLAMFKLGVVFAQLHALYLQGRRGDARYAGFGSLAGDLLALTIDIIHGRAV